MSQPQCVTQTMATIVSESSKNSPLVLQLMFMYGAMRCLRSNEVDLPHLEPGQEGTVMVTFIAPPDFGEYYRLVMIHLRPHKIAHANYDTPVPF